MATAEDAIPPRKFDDLSKPTDPEAPETKLDVSLGDDPLVHRDLKDGPFWKQIPAFADASEEEFLDYKWQMKNSLYGPSKLVELMEGLAPDEFVEDAKRGFALAPMAVRVTPYLLSLIDWDDPWNDPIRTQFMPVGSRLTADHPMLTLDSLHEQKDAPVDGLTHRYPDKALFLPLDTCPVYCRFCTRSYAIGVDTDSVEKVKLRVNPKRWEEAFDYIEKTPQLEDIVISGGDAFNLAFKHIENIGMRLLEMPNIRRLRYATKGLAVMPMKILSDERWLDAMTRVVERGRELHKQVVIHTHFNHPNEITAISRRACNKLFERGVVVRNQSVLQRGVNDDPETMALLVKRLGEINVHPYYVYQHDMVQGVEDLRTSVNTNKSIEKYVRGVTAGFNTPTFVVDAPGGGGKRAVHSHEHYDRETGVSVYTAPSVKPDEHFLYFDPLHSLDDEVVEAWNDDEKSDEMVAKALRDAGVQPAG